MDEKKLIELEEAVLKKNDEIANSTRSWLTSRKIKTINLISSPGSGKTYLLEKTLLALQNKIKVAVLVGDQETSNDADRLMNKGARVKQINTHSSCHLDALMIKQELSFLDGNEALLIIENIGNLVCPASFDLGEDEKIALLSTTEGEDKPIKYPVLFSNAKTVVITKMDLAPHLDWSLEKTQKYIYQINPKARIIALSAKSGEGMNEWINFLCGKK